MYSENRDKGKILNTYWHNMLKDIKEEHSNNFYLIAKNLIENMPDEHEVPKEHMLKLAQSLLDDFYEDVKNGYRGQDE